MQITKNVSAYAKESRGHTRASKGFGGTMRFEHYYFDSRVLEPLHGMLRDNGIELVRLAVPYSISFVQRLEQLRAAKALAAVSGASNPPPDAIPIACDLWFLDSKQQLYRATLRSDSRFSFVPMSSGVASIFSTPTGRVMGIDQEGELLEDSSGDDFQSLPDCYSNGRFALGPDVALQPLKGGSPTKFVDATFIGEILVGIDKYGTVWRRLPERNTTPGEASADPLSRQQV